MQLPKQSHSKSDKYINQSPRMWILMSSKSTYSLVCYCDADCAACHNTRRSVTDFFVKFGESLVYEKSKKQLTVSRSYAEVEYKSLAATTAEIIRLLAMFT